MLVPGGGVRYSIHRENGIMKLNILASVYNFYLAFMRLAFELQVERMLAARAIVRKLFQK
jgi:hypothetical protein